MNEWKKRADFSPHLTLKRKDETCFLGVLYDHMKSSAEAEAGVERVRSGNVFLLCSSTRKVPKRLQHATIYRTEHEHFGTTVKRAVLLDGVTESVDLLVVRNIHRAPFLLDTEKSCQGRMAIAFAIISAHGRAGLSST